MKKTIFFFTILSLLIITIPAMSGNLRNYEPVVLTADSINYFLGSPVQKLFVFSYDAQSSTWHAIPFQIDEIDTTVSDEEKYFGNNDGLFNGKDELVFLTNGLGDKAPLEKWIEGMDTTRAELAFFDPIRQKSGYVYLYRSTTNNFSVPDPYQMQYDKDTDQIESLHYAIGFNNTGQLSDVTIKNSIGGSEQDIFDRIKIRFYLSFFTLFLSAGEDSIIFDHAYAKTGPVRVIRNMVATFVYRPLLDGQEFTQTSFFYPWHGEFKLVDLPIGELSGFPYVEIDEFRLSWDMNNNAVGMKLFSDKNPSGVLIDGNQEADVFNPACVPDQFNWTLASGDQGAMLNIFYVPALGDSIPLYYHDAADGTSGDYQPLFSFDSGDMLSYGDNGFSLIGNIEFYVTPTTTFDFLYYNFFLGENFPADSAAILTENLKNPLRFSMSQQNFISTGVADEPSLQIVESFSLSQNFPNPFNSSTTIMFELSSQSNVRLGIYDINGRLLHVLANEKLSAGRHEFTWNGTNRSGQALPTGIYFYKLTSKFGSKVKKLLLVR